MAASDSPFLSTWSVLSSNAWFLSDSYNDLSDSYGEERTCFGVIPVRRLNCCVRWLWQELPTCKAMSAIAKSVFDSINFARSTRC